MKHNSSLFFTEGIFDDKLTVEVSNIWSTAQAPQVAQDWLSSNPGFQWRGEWRKQGSQSLIDVYRTPPQIDFGHVSPDHKAMLAELAQILAQAKPDITSYLKQLPAVGSQEICKQVVDRLPVKMKKVQYLNQEDSFADQMKSLKTMNSLKHRREVMQRIVDIMARYLQYNRGYPVRPVDFDLISLSLRQALCCNPEETFEFVPKEKDEDIQEAELEGLDDFLLKDQDDDPSIIEQL